MAKKKNQNIIGKKNLSNEPFLYISQNNHTYFFTWELSQAACPHFSRTVFFLFTSAAVGCSHQFSSSSLSVYSYLTLYSVLLIGTGSVFPPPLPYVHTLFSNLRSENAIIECLSIQLDHRDMLFLPISFAPFRRLNNVCVSGTSTRWDAGGCRWESSVCQVCH